MCRDGAVFVNAGATSCKVLGVKEEAPAEEEEAEEEEENRRGCGW